MAVQTDHFLEFGPVEQRVTNRANIRTLKGTFTNARVLNISSIALFATCCFESVGKMPRFLTLQPAPTTIAIINRQPHGIAHGSFQTVNVGSHGGGGSRGTSSTKCFRHRQSGIPF
jgi:hypothetical protein